MHKFNKIRAFFLSFTIIFCYVSAGAQNPSRFKKPVFFKYTDESGLPPTMIEDICESQDGQIWLASWRGLYSFDGVNFTNYSAPSVNNIQDSRFFSIATDRFRTVWALTYEGKLYVLPDGKKELSPSLENLSFDRLFSHGDGNVFMHSLNGSIYTASPYSAPEPLLHISADLPVHDIFKCQDSDNIYVLTPKGLLLDRTVILNDELFCIKKDGNLLYFGGRSGLIVTYDGSDFNYIDTDIPSDLKFIVPIPQTDCVLTGSAETGVYTYNIETGEIIELTKPYCADEFEVLVDESGRIYLFSDNASLSIFSRSRWDLIPYYNPDTQSAWNPENTVHAAYTGSRGQLWYSGSSRGLERSHVYDESISLMAPGSDAYATPGNSIRAIGDNLNGLVYIATADNKIHLIDSRHNVTRVIPVNCSINDFARDINGTYWFATSEGMIENDSQLDFLPKYYTPSPDFYSLISPNVRTLCATGYGRLWIGSSEGLSYLDINDKDRKFISKKNLLSFPTGKSHNIRHICEDNDGQRIYGCGNLGIFYCDTPQAAPSEMEFKWLEELSGMEFYHIQFSSNGLLYASSIGNGLLVVDDKDSGHVRTRYTVDNGLLSNYVLSTIEDENGNIWIVTHAGLNRLNPVTGSMISLPQERFSSNLLLNNTKPLAGADGTLYFGTNKGLLYFNPDEILNSDYIPEIILSDLFVGTERISVSNGGTVRLRAGEKMMVRFKAVDMAAPERVVYAYRLLGRKNEIVQLGKEGYVVLQDFRTGKYTLELRSSNSDGQAVENPYIIKVSVFPSHLSVIMLVGALLLFVGLSCFFSIRASRRRKLVQIEDPESKQFVDRLNAYLTENMDNADLCAADISNALGVSRSMLFSKCKEYLGTPPLELLASLRMKKAVELLETTELRIAQVAFMVGFSDSQYFSKVFKARFGKTPTQYRRSVQEPVQPSSEITPDTARNA